MMNDYKELIAKLRFYANTADDPIYGICINSPKVMLQAADAIEQLAKKRDESKKNCDSCAKKTTNCITWLQEELAKIQKERDADVDDLGRNKTCSACNNNKNIEVCKECLHIDLLAGQTIHKLWEWRGV